MEFKCFEGTGRASGVARRCSVCGYCLYCTIQYVLLAYAIRFKRREREREAVLLFLCRVKKDEGQTKKVRWQVKQSKHGTNTQAAVQPSESASLLVYRNLLKRATAFPETCAGHEGPTVLLLQQ